MRFTDKKKNPEYINSQINKFEYLAYVLDKKINDLNIQYNLLNNKKNLGAFLLLKKIQRNENKILKLLNNKKIRIDRLDFLQNLSN